MSTLAATIASFNESTLPADAIKGNGTNPSRGNAHYRSCAAAHMAPLIADLPADKAADWMVRGAAHLGALGWSDRGTFDASRSKALMAEGLSALLARNGLSAGQAGMLANCTNGGELLRAIAALATAPAGTPARTVLSTLDRAPRIRAALIPASVAETVKVEKPAAGETIEAAEGESIVLPINPPKGAVKGKGKPSRKGGK